MAIDQQKKKERCAICGGPEEDHANSRHAFTTQPGDLRRPVPPQQPQRIAMTSAEPVATALMNLLLEKELISMEEALGCFGVHGRRDGSSGGPQQRPSSGFSDPARLTGQ